MSGESSGIGPGQTPYSEPTHFEDTAIPAFVVDEVDVSSVDELSLHDLSEVETQEIERLARVYRCRPDELVLAVGRQLRRIDGPTPLWVHRDVFVLEAVARLSVATGLPISELEADGNDTASAVTLTDHIRHMRSCEVCTAGVDQFLKLFPTRDQLRTAEIQATAPARLNADSA